MGRLKEAVQDLKNAAALAPDSESTLLLVGTVLIRLGDCNGAIEYFDKLLTRNNRHVEGWFNKGLALYKLKSFEEAIMCFEKALKIDPDHIDSQRQRKRAVKGLSAKKKAHSFVWSAGN